MNLTKEAILSNEALQTTAKELFFKDISRTSIALVHDIFRNGPVEDIHAGPDSKLSDKEMKIINKYMVDQLAGILDALQREDWLSLYFLTLQNRFFGREWDEAEYYRISRGPEVLQHVWDGIDKYDLKAPDFQSASDFLIWLDNYLG